MINQNQKNSKGKNVTLTNYDNTPKKVIANTARFNKQFLNKQLGGNPISISIGKMLTVMSDQDNTIRTLSRILGRDHNDQHLHDMHNEIFGGLIGQSGSGREGMDLSGISSQLTTFIHQQNLQIQTLIDEIRRNLDEINSQIQSSSTTNTSQ